MLRIATVLPFALSHRSRWLGGWVTGQEPLLHFNWSYADKGVYRSGFPTLQTRDIEDDNATARNPYRWYARQVGN